ncbi:unnamed protein product [Cladocopium goreaui]|uniref:HTH La-type RNA-binding domain-containing protein n=1 Tax=Cladocopium goreaui TaxID=2562237 RepID=A0A9P1G1A1_9DINO|nr:unnamed protein product [Cladocopium goreaui]
MGADPVMDADPEEPPAKALKVVDLSKVRRQVEFYFTDRNLSRDVALREAAEPGAWLSGQWLLQCPKLQREGITLEELHTAVKASDLLELDEEASKVRRKEEYGPWPSLKLPCRPGGTVLVLRKKHDSSESTGESEDCSSASQGEESSPSQEICRMESQERAQQAQEKLPLDASKDEAPATAEAQAREAADTAPAALSGEEAAEATVEAEEAEKGTTRAAARRFLRDWKIPKTAICGLSEPNSFGEVVVALHPFPGDLHLLTTAAPEGWEPRALFGSQRFKALQFLPKRVRRELLEGPTAQKKWEVSAEHSKRIWCWSVCDSPPPPPPKNGSITP